MRMGMSGRRRGESPGGGHLSSDRGVRGDLFPYALSLFWIFGGSSVEMAMSCHKEVTMDSETMLPAQLDDWEVLKRFLPDGWQEQAKTQGAFQRPRKVKDA